LRSDPTIALRVTMSNSPTPAPRRVAMHLRGTALDHYDGRTWSQSLDFDRVRATGNGMVVVGAHPDEQSDPVMRVDLEPIDPPVLFLPPNATAFRLQRAGTLAPGGGMSVHGHPEGEMRYTAPHDRGVRYSVFLSPEGRPTFRVLKAGERQRYLQLPADLPDRIRTLAADWVEGIEGDYQRAKAIEKQLRTAYRYDLSSPSGAHAQPLDHFLFESRRGHCEYYSTAMAVMLRAQGVPTRNVTGFVGGTYNTIGKFYAVRQGDAHSWVEAYMRGRGWMTFDPTPPGSALPQGELEGALVWLRDLFEAASQKWDRRVLGYDLRQQVGLFESLTSRNSATSKLFRKPSRRTLMIGAALLVILPCMYLIYRRRRRGGDEESEGEGTLTRDAAVATALYRSLDRVMATIGLSRGSTTPPLHHARALAGLGHPLASEIMALTRRYLDARFGRQPIHGDEQRDFEQRVRGLRDAARQLPASQTTLGALEENAGDTEPSERPVRTAAAPADGDHEARDGAGEDDALHDSDAGDDDDDHGSDDIDAGDDENAQDDEDAQVDDDEEDDEDEDDEEDDEEDDDEEDDEEDG
jgi:hypothetical protein